MKQQIVAQYILDVKSRWRTTVLLKYLQRRLFRPPCDTGPRLAPSDAVEHVDPTGTQCFGELQLPCYTPILRSALQSTSNFGQLDATIRLVEQILWTRRPYEKGLRLYIAQHPLCPQAVHLYWGSMAALHTTLRRWELDFLNEWTVRFEDTTEPLHVVFRD